MKYNTTLKFVNFYPLKTTKTGIYTYNFKLLWKHDIPRCLTARFLKEALEFEDLHLG